MKATEKDFPVVLRMLYKVVLAYLSVHMILNCDYSDQCGDSYESAFV